MAQRKITWSIVYPEYNNDDHPERNIYPMLAIGGKYGHRWMAIRKGATEFYIEDI